MNDPRLAIWLYLALVITSLMFRKSWGTVIAAVEEGVAKR